MAYHAAVYGQAGHDEPHALATLANDEKNIIAKWTGTRPIEIIADLPGSNLPTPVWRNSFLPRFRT